MKTLFRLLNIALIACSFPTAIWGALTISGANGKDGVFAPTVSTSVDLRNAIALPWNSDVATGGTGVYDADKWAVVFRYESVRIPAGVTVTFKNHGSCAPVVWIVSGDVAIDGAIQLSAERGGANTFFAAAGPGGFRGGKAIVADIPGSGGFGIGGGSYSWYADALRDGSHRGTQWSGAASYGGERRSILIGGSGGGGTYERDSYHGGGGGGAMLIAAQGQVTLNGYMGANGGLYAGGAGTGSGSGGSVRLISDVLEGRGSIQCLGPNVAGHGRISIEARMAENNTISSTPEPYFEVLSSSTVDLFPLIAPKARIKAVSGLSAPTDPKALLGATPADVVVPQVGDFTVLVETENFEPVAARVTLYVIPTQGQRIAIAATSPRPGATFARAEWEVPVTLQAGKYAMQAHAVGAP